MVGPSCSSGAALLQLDAFQVVASDKGLQRPKAKKAQEGRMLKKYEEVEDAEDKEDMEDA